MTLSETRIFFVRKDIFTYIPIFAFYVKRKTYFYTEIFIKGFRGFVDKITPFFAPGTISIPFKRRGNCGVLATT